MLTYQNSLENFKDQLNYVLDNYKPHGLKLSSVKNIVISGLGGSGISGRITKAFFNNIIEVPIEVVSDYTLPAYAGKDTLLVLSSYSGNTEETLSTYHEGKEKGCKMLILTGGGLLLDEAIANNYLHYQVAPGFQPRMALGFSLSFMYCIFSELAGMDAASEIRKAVSALEDEKSWKDELSKFTAFFAGREAKRFNITTDAAYEAVSLRFCQQLNENSKCEAFLHTLPEVNHNVIESYYGVMDSNLVFVNSKQHPRVDLRFKFLKELLESKGNKVYVFEPKDKSFSEMVRLIHIHDWYSIKIAHTLGRDEHKIDNIVSLKTYLSK